MSEFDPHWPHGHQTRNGFPARILATDAKGSLGDSRRPVVAEIQDRDGRWIVKQYGSCGNYKLVGAGEDPIDLVNAPAPKRKSEVWLNLWDNGVVSFASTVDSHPRIVGRKRVVVQEGEFDV